MIVEKNGFFNCNGTGKCGGTHFHSRESVKRSFNCDECESYIKTGLKIVDKRAQKGLTNWF